MNRVPLKQTIGGLYIPHHPVKSGTNVVATEEAVCPGEKRRKPRCAQVGAILSAVCTLQETTRAQLTQMINVENLYDIPLHWLVQVSTDPCI